MNLLRIAARFQQKVELHKTQTKEFAKKVLLTTHKNRSTKGKEKESRNEIELELAPCRRTCNVIVFSFFFLSFNRLKNRSIYLDLVQVYWETF
jgi:hypothetical protein